MMTEYKLNQLIEWTDADRAKGKCPVPEWSVVTLWLEDATCLKVSDPNLWDWSDSPTLGDEVITAYLIHSVPRGTIVRWMVVGGCVKGWRWHKKKEVAEKVAKQSGGRVVKMVEAQE